MNRIRQLLDARYASRPVRLSARVTQRPLDANGRNLGYLIAEVAGVPGVRVNVSPSVTYYPGDIIQVEQRGAAAAAAYDAVGWESGARPDAGVIEFPSDTSIGGVNYGAGDQLWGNPFAAHFHMDYSEGHINLKVGSTLTGRIDAGTGKFTAGNPSGLHGDFTATGITFYDGATALTGWSTNQFWIGPAPATERLVYNNGSLSLIGAAGNVQLASTGLTLAYGDAAAKQVRWLDGATLKGYIGCYDGWMPGNAMMEISGDLISLAGVTKAQGGLELAYGDFIVNDGSVLNESGNDNDTRIEGKTDENLVFVDASTDRVGIGTNAPDAKLSVTGNTHVAGDLTVDFATVLNETGADSDTRIEGDTDANLVFVDASTDRVGIGTNAPGTKLDVNGSVFVRGGLTAFTDSLVLGDVTMYTNGKNATLHLYSDLAQDFTGYRVWVEDTEGLAFGRTAGVPEVLFGASEIVFNRQMAAYSTRFCGDTDGTLLTVNASTDQIGIGTSTPGAKLDVRGGMIINELGASVDTRIEGDNDQYLLYVRGDTDRVAVGFNAPSQKFAVNGDIGYYGNLVRWSNATAYTGYVAVPLTTPKTSTSYDGDAVNTGTYQFDLSASPWALPDGITGVFVRLSSKWTAASDGSYALLRPKSGSGAAVIVRAGAANINADAAGYVPCSGGDIELVVGGANTTATTIEIWGYTI